MAKKRRKASKKTTTDFKNQLLEVYKTYPDKSFNYKQLSNILNLNRPAEKEALQVLLQKLEADGLLINENRGQYKFAVAQKYALGKVDMTAKGNAYIISEDFENDIYISAKHTLNALNGDWVKVWLFPRSKKNKPEGEIVEVMERAKKQFVGTLQVSEKYAFLLPDDKNMHVDIFIHRKNLNNGKDGEKAVVEIIEWAKNASKPEGKVSKVLGQPGTHQVEMNSIMAEYGLPTDFPTEIENDAQKLNLDISSDEIKKRRDYRTVNTFTIDPDDAKDFDDALSIYKLKNGNWEVGVHIADVSHYVKPDTLLDKEAYQRATSVYLVDRVVPMLPEILSNGVCSLRPNEDKLTFSAIFEMNENAEIVNQWFGKTVTHSNRRFTYGEAQKVIEMQSGDYVIEILTLDKLAKKLKKKRFENGAIDFDKVEVKFQLDDEGNPIGVFLKEMKDSNKLIEEFMLLANKKVAAFIGKPNPKSNPNPKTFVYRVHDKPDPEKVAQFSNFISRFGYKINDKTPEDTAHSINDLIEKVKGSPEQDIISQLAIRTMAKAHYTTNNIGHYGLAFDFYTHFTSPIRRYPDIIVHRLLQQYLDGKNSANPKSVEEQCKHSSEMEKVATDAERASIKYKQVEFLADKVGQEFNGVISGITDFGIFIEIEENKCEGMIRLRDMKDDHYWYDEENMCVKGRKYGHKFTLGEKVEIRIKKADLVKKQLDFELIF